jgi:hypothetical protein
VLVGAAVAREIDGDDAVGFGEPHAGFCFFEDAVALFF